MKYLYVLSICFICSLGFSQDDLIKEATNFLESNKVFKNHPKEKFFLHTNKTTYFAGEHIMYKAYVVDDFTNVPSSNTTNLHFSIYDYNGKLIRHQLIFVENGLVNGSVELEKDLKSGSYYLVLDTNYNASFDRKNISQIQVLNLLDKNIITVAEKELVDDIQIEESKGVQVEFYPESNVLLSRANNNLYYKISLNEMPFEAKGELVKSFNDEVVGEFSSNKRGLGFVNFDYYPDREYYFKIRHNQNTYKINIPIAQKEGFIIHHDFSKPISKEISFTVRINNDTAGKNDNETILAVIHRDNVCKSVIPFKIDKDVNNYLLSINSESLYNGVNVISLFNKQNEALSSRYFFYDKKKNIELSIEKFNETKDSLTLDLKMLNSYIMANTSVSILPKENIVNNNSQTIYKAFLISPYVSITSNSLEFDLALQTANLVSDVSEASKNVQLRNAENGISISGEVKTNITNLSGYSVLLTSKENGFALLSDIENNKFVFNNLLLYHPSKYELALLNSVNMMVDADFQVEEQKLDFPADSILDLTQVALKHEPIVANSQYNFVIEGEELNEVVLTGKKRKEEVVNEFPDFGIIDEPGELGNGFTRRKTKDKIECNGCTLFDYLDQFSELKTLRKYPDGFHVYFKSRGFNTVYGSIDALLIVNGIPSSLSVMADIMADDVKAVKLNRSGAGYGFQGSNGVILVELKKVEDYLDTDLNEGNPKDLKLFSTNTTFGFTKSNDIIEADNLIFNSQNSREKYSIIDWIPNFTLKPNSSNLIKIPKESYTALKLIINGINDQGDMVSEEVNISFN
ncbi:hypothetical protein [Xanthomarina sp.]|uniref:hypothetical protein n=1 Tax=Xanthomarina sp. TaxID=1931211 RepID=UPI002C923B81|nr:hypothetical protein [Xanthomarina sp.]HLV38964.1 hypothetical protein [Xanthomarina sp.]